LLETPIHFFGQLLIVLRCLGLVGKPCSRKGRRPRRILDAEVVAVAVVALVIGVLAVVLDDRGRAPGRRRRQEGA